MFTTTLIALSLSAFAGDSYAIDGGDEPKEDETATFVNPDADNSRLDLTTEDGRGGDDECEKSIAGCIDDYATQDYDTYVRELHGAIDEMLRAPNEPVGQLSEGHVVFSFRPNLDQYGNEIDPGPGGDVWTEKVAFTSASFIEHWFPENSTMFDDPGLGFDLEYVQPLEMDEMQDVLDDDPDYMSEPYSEMLVHYVDKPSDGMVMAQALYQGEQVDRFTFVLKYKGEVAGHMMREIHYEGLFVVGRYDHWFFHESYDLVHLPGEVVEVQAKGITPESTADWYFKDFGEKPIVRVAVVDYEPASITNFFPIGLAP